MNTIRRDSVKQGAFYRKLIQTHGSPLVAVDGRRVRSQYHDLKQALPGVDLYYAIKSFPQPDLVGWLYNMGAGFDVASSGEIDLVRQLHIPARRTIHTHPIKRDSDIRDALRYGCTTFVVDNADELLKFLPYKNRVGLLLRISFRSSAAVVDLSKKFGCDIAEVPGMLDLARKLGIHFKGLSFHVGSQCTDARRQVEAIAACNAIIRRHHADSDVPISILDIGGGFPVAYDFGHVDIGAYCAPIVHALAELPPYVNVIAEPGRFLSAPSAKCIATVIGKALRQGRYWYYLDDGVYGSFSGQLYDHTRYPLEIFSDDDRRFPSVLAGPTCDSIDLIAEDVYLPPMELGNIVVGHMMGAYTTASATDFNFVKRAKVVPLNATDSVALSAGSNFMADSLTRAYPSIDSTTTLDPFSMKGVKGTKH